MKNVNCPNCKLQPIIFDFEYGKKTNCQFCGTELDIDNKGNIKLKEE